MGAIAWINFGLALAEAATKGIAVATEARDLVRQLVAEGRDPTDEEWIKINALTDDLDARIQAAAGTEAGA